jgi:imidazolonepropionase-like amidohydrolase
MLTHDYSRWYISRAVVIRAVVPFLLVVFVAAGSRTAHAQIASDPQPPAVSLAIVGGLLLDGHEGPPIPDSVVLINGKTVVAVGTRHSLKVPNGAKVIDARGYSVLPGLIDRHVHLDLLGHADYRYWHSAYASRADEVYSTSARQLLSAGVTTAVDMGGDPAVQVRIRDRINKGEIPGPRMKVSAGWICNWSDEYFSRHHRKGYVFNVRTVEEARAAATKTLALGADIFKLYTGLTGPQVKVITEEAHKKGVKVVGHTSGNADLISRVSNGMDGVEHVHGFDPSDEEVIRTLRVHRAVVTPGTNGLAIVQAFEDPTWLDNPRFRLLTPPDIYVDIRRSLGRIDRLPYFQSAVRPQVVTETLRKIKELYDARIPMHVSSDSAGPANFHTDQTRRWMELMVRAGVPPMEVIGAATRLPAEWLGIGDKVGTIAPGKSADIIIVDGNPLLHMQELKDVVYVLKEGVQYKGASPTNTLSSDGGR